MTQTGDVIKRFEGFHSKAYWDVQQWSVGYGSYAGSRDKNIPPTINNITEQEGSELFQQQLSTYERAVDKYDSTYNWTDKERAALTSFAYNNGGIDGLTANGTRSREQIADKMMEYSKARTGPGGSLETVDGLVSRRAAERHVFLGNDVPEGDLYEWGRENRPPGWENAGQGNNLQGAGGLNEDEQTVENAGAEGRIVEGDEPSTTPQTSNVDDSPLSLTTNWLSTVDSPQYLWTLYITDAETFNNPAPKLKQFDRSSTATNASIIAKTGVTTLFSIDNFAMISTVTPGQAHGSTTPGIIQFDIFENLGFTFLDRVLTAGQALGVKGNLPTQNFVLKLEFIGRDATTGASKKYPQEFYYPIKINQLRAQAGAEGTRYNIVAFTVIKHAQTESVLNTPVTVSGVTTVKSFLEELETQLNNAQKSKIGPMDQRSGVTPRKIFKIITSDANDEVTTRIAERGYDPFDLLVQSFGKVVNSDTTDGKDTSLDNVDALDIAFMSNDDIPTRLVEILEKNIPALATYVEKCQTAKVPAVPYVTVTPRWIPRVGPTEHNQNMMGNAGTLELVVGMAMNYTTVTDENQHAADFVDQTKQGDRLQQYQDANVLIKRYDYLYSGLNTEVLNYQIDVESLFVVVSEPAAGVYSTNKSQMFTGTNPIKSTRYVEEIPFNRQDNAFKYNVVNFEERPLSLDEQRNLSNDGGNTVNAARAMEMAKRGYDAIEFRLDIKGDPLWMGQPGEASGNELANQFIKSDASIAFINYNPNADDLIENGDKGPVDMVSTGVYKVTKIESKFSGGEFTQTLVGYKDVQVNPYLIINELLNLGK